MASSIRWMYLIPPEIVLQLAKKSYITLGRSQDTR